MDAVKLSSSVKIGRFFRTRLRLHYSWLLAFILITFAVTTQFSTDQPFWLRISSGLGASLLFLVSIFIRELVLILMAIYRGINVEGVTFFAFGGLIEVEPETTSPAQEFTLAITGMLANLIIAGIFYISYVLLTGSVPEAVDIIIKWLAFLYFTLTLFHFIPGYPLEGGRMFRALLWKMVKNLYLATQIAGWISWALGVLIAIGGILLTVFTVERFTGVFLIAIGLILQNAATHSRREQRRVTVPIEPQTPEKPQEPVETEEPREPAETEEPGEPAEEEEPEEPAVT